MIEWVGSILHEYYAGFRRRRRLHHRSPRMAGRFVALSGVSPAPGAVKLYDEAGDEITERNRPGTIYFQVSPISPFEYFPRTQRPRRHLPKQGRLFHTWRCGDTLMTTHLPLPHRAHRRMHHLRRRQHLSAGDRQRDHQTPGRRRQLRHRRPQRGMGRGGEGGGHSCTRAGRPVMLLERISSPSQRPGSLAYKIPRLA